MHPLAFVSLICTKLGSEHHVLYSQAFYFVIATALLQCNLESKQSITGSKLKSTQNVRTHLNQAIAKRLKFLLLIIHLQSRIVVDFYIKEKIKKQTAWFLILNNLPFLVYFILTKC